MFPDRIETERLILRPIALADAPAILAAYGTDPEVSRFTTWRPHAILADTERFVAGCVADTASRSLVLTLRGADVPIGVLDLRRPTLSRIEYGCVLQRRFWNRGLMTEALHGAIRWAFEQASIWRFGAVVDVENHASARVMEKAGLSREGVLRRWLVHPNLGNAPRDCFSYAITRESDQAP